MHKRRHIFLTTGICAALAAAVILACTIAESGKDDNIDTRAATPGAAVFDYFTYEGNDDFYNANPLTDESSYYNPILPGWYSDPSICTNGNGDYYLVTSTFVFFPGVPIFHSRDLVNWKQIGNVLNRESQLVNMQGQDISGGIFAPAIAYNPGNKMYYMITTNVGYGNFFVKTADPAGDWSDPIRLPDVGGIDPSFFFDEDGRAYIVNNDDAPDGQPEYDGHRTIRIREFNVENDKTIGKEKVLVNKGAVPADNPIWIEGPHMYRIRGDYFLMSAEGGTGDRHSEVIFKSSSPFGPFEAWDGNPILTQRTLGDRENPVTCAGHADLVEGTDGNWQAVFLACRPIDNDFENLGRETFMMPVRWSSDGFPYITRDGETVALTGKIGGAVREDNVTFGNFAVKDNFDSETLGLGWMTLRSPATDKYSLTAAKDALTLYCSDETATGKGVPALVCRRLQHHKFECTTRMTFAPADNEAAGLLLLKDETHQYFFAMRSSGGNNYITLLRIDAEDQTTVAERKLPDGTAAIEMKISSTGKDFAFAYSVSGGQWQELCSGIDARFLSTANAGGFTGTVVGMYAVKTNQRDAENV